MTIPRTADEPSLTIALHFDESARSHPVAFLVEGAACSKQPLRLGTTEESTRPIGRSGVRASRTNALAGEAVFAETAPVTGNKYFAHRLHATSYLANT